MKLLKLIIFSFILIQFTNCASFNKNEPELRRQWMLVSFKNYPKETLVKHKASIDFSPVKTNENQYGAFMGCNRMFFTAKFGGNGTVKFSGVGSTMMYCDKMMDLEAQFAKELPQMTHYAINGHYLTLSADNGSEMKFVAADWD